MLCRWALTHSPTSSPTHSLTQLTHSPTHQVTLSGASAAGQSQQAQLAQQLESQFASLQPDEQLRVAAERMQELRRAVSLAAATPAGAMPLAEDH